MTYSNDLRKKVLSIKEQDKLTFSETAKRFGVGQASVVRWSKNIEPQRTRNKPTVKLDWETLAQDVQLRGTRGTRGFDEVKMFQPAR
jgi:transposase